MFGYEPQYRKNPSSARMLSNLIDVVRLSNDSAQATSTPSPEPVHKSDVPEIDGSHGAFIGLMVGLSAIILICCGLVYYLLRTRPRDAGDAARGLYRSPKDSRTKGQWNDEFDADSEDEDIEKQIPLRRRDGDRADGNGPSAPKTQENARHDSGDDDSFDPEKIRATVVKSGSSAAPTQSAS